MIRFEISHDADQKFSLILNNHRVTFRFWYNRTVDRWSFDLSRDDIPIINGRRVVIGANLIAPFNLDIGKLFAVPMTPNAVPDRENFPNGNVRLFQLTDVEYDNAISP